jgi:nitrite reductase/ring-hydroxylating ferredoxin subunit
MAHAIAHTAIPVRTESIVFVELSAEVGPSPMVENPRENLIMPLNHVVCPFVDTTAPTKEGLFQDDRIVSNLHGANALQAL